MLRAWIIDDDKSIRWVLEKALTKAGLTCEAFSNAHDALMLLKEQDQQPDVILSDIRMPGMDGIELLKLMGQQYPHIPMIIMTAHSDLDSAVSAYDKGAFEYLPKPFDMNEVVEQVRKACRRGIQYDSAPKDPNVSTSEIIGAASAMQEVFRAIGRLSRSNITVLINGESGTGKELVAHALHRHSPRSQGIFIALNMAAIPRELLESELFGHEKGAFTGAQGRRLGRFEQANGGTLFLDEIGDMPPELQTRLLRVLATGEFYRVGGHEPVSVDVRIIAATHQNLESRVADHRFREDLFHRLNVIRIHLPPLRERREDIPLLMTHFMEQAALELGSDPKQLLPETLEILKDLAWPGNVRQLENTARWLTVMAAGQFVHVEDLPPELMQTLKQPLDYKGPWQTALHQWARDALSRGQQDLLHQAVPEFERILLETALTFTGGRKLDAAKLLGWGRNTLTRKLKEFALGDEL